MKFPAHLYIMEDTTEYKDTKLLNSNEEGQVSAGSSQNSKRVSNKKIGQIVNIPMLLYGSPPPLGNLDDLKSDVEDGSKSSNEIQYGAQNKDFDSRK